MNAIQLIASIIFYILSLVISLVLMMVSGRISLKAKKRFIIFHIALLLVYFISFFFIKSANNFSFMLFFCFGICISGLIVRSSITVWLKIIYAVFPLSILLFLYSPSLLLSLLATQKVPIKTNTEFNLKENFYLAKQQSMLTFSSPASKYKIISKSGNFYKTLERDISFPATVDSIRLVYFTKDSISLYGYYTGPENKVDSAIATSDLKMNNRSEILIKH